MTAEFIANLLTLLVTHIPDSGLGVWPGYEPLVHAQIEHVWGCAHFRLEHHQLVVVLFHHAPDLAVGVAYVGDNTGAAHTGFHTRWQKTHAQDRKTTRLNSTRVRISCAAFRL